MKTSIIKYLKKSALLFQKCQIWLNSITSLKNTCREHNQKETDVVLKHENQTRDESIEKDNIAPEKMGVDTPVRVKAKRSKRKKLKLPSKKEKRETKVDYSFIKVEDLPDTINDSTIYIVGENGYCWLAAFKCPCGCNDIIQLNLLKETKPCWKIISYKNGTYSISPSVDRLYNCKSHFTINKGLVSWWGDRNNYYP